MEWQGWEQVIVLGGCLVAARKKKDRGGQRERKRATTVKQRKWRRRLLLLNKLLAEYTSKTGKFPRQVPATPGDLAWHPIEMPTNLTPREWLISELTAMGNVIYKNRQTGEVKEITALDAYRINPNDPNAEFALTPGLKKFLNLRAPAPARPKPRQKQSK